MENRVVAVKIANALVENAKPKSDLATSKMTGIPDSAFEGMISAFTAYYGGLWVGGKVTLTTQGLSFESNRINKAAHRELPLLQVSLSQVVSIELLPGVLTRIIAVKTSTHVLKFRCWGAGKMVRLVQECVEDAVQESGG